MRDVKYQRDKDNYKGWKIEKNVETEKQTCETERQDGEMQKWTEQRDWKI